jgi:hypothetical protein
MKNPKIIYFIISFVLIVASVCTFFFGESITKLTKYKVSAQNSYPKPYYFSIKLTQNDTIDVLKNA